MSSGPPPVFAMETFATADQRHQSKAGIEMLLDRCAASLATI